MQKISLAQALLIAEKIDRGIDHLRDPRFSPLYQQPFLAESFLHLVRALDTGVNVDIHQHNFVNVCRLLCPEFVSILTDIELDSELLSHHMDAPEPDILSPHVGLPRHLLCDGDVGSTPK